MNEGRRRFVTAATVTAVLGASGLLAVVARRARGADAETFEVTHTAEEWKKLLTPNQFKVLREAATERPFFPTDMRSGSSSTPPWGCGSNLSVG